MWIEVELVWRDGSDGVELVREGRVSFSLRHVRFSLGGFFGASFMAGFSVVVCET